MHIRKVRYALKPLMLAASSVNVFRCMLNNDISIGVTPKKDLIEHIAVFIMVHAKRGTKNFKVGAFMNGSLDVWYASPRLK